MDTPTKFKWYVVYHFNNKIEIEGFHDMDIAIAKLNTLYFEGHTDVSLHEGTIVFNEIFSSKEKKIGKLN